MVVEATASESQGAGVGAEGSGGEGGEENRVRVAGYQRVTRSAAAAAAKEEANDNAQKRGAEEERSAAGDNVREGREARVGDLEADGVEDESRAQGAEDIDERFVCVARDDSSDAGGGLMAEPSRQELCGQAARRRAEAAWQRFTPSVVDERRCDARVKDS